MSVSLERKGESRGFEAESRGDLLTFRSSSQQTDSGDKRPLAVVDATEMSRPVTSLLLRVVTKSLVLLAGEMEDDRLRCFRDDDR